MWESGLDLARVVFGMRCSAHCFADCLLTSTECCLVLDALESNSSLKSLCMHGEIVISTPFMLLRSMRWGWAAVVLQTFACNACVCNRLQAGR